MTRTHLPVGAWFLVLGLSACANRGMQAPDDDPVRPATSRPGTVADAGSPGEQHGRGHRSVPAERPAPAARLGTGGRAQHRWDARHWRHARDRRDARHWRHGRDARHWRHGRYGAERLGMSVRRVGRSIAPARARCAWRTVTSPTFRVSIGTPPPGNFAAPAGCEAACSRSAAPTSSVGTAVVDTAAQDLNVNAKVTELGRRRRHLRVLRQREPRSRPCSSRPGCRAAASSGCTWQVQLQTQDQRAATDTDPTGGTCSGTLLRVPGGRSGARPARRRRPTRRRSPRSTTRRARTSRGQPNRRPAVASDGGVAPGLLGRAAHRRHQRSGKTTAGRRGAQNCSS